MWPAGVCLGRAVRRSQFRVLHDDRTVQQRCDTDEHHPSAAASPRPVVAAGVPTSVAGARDASGDDHARRCGRPSPPAPLPRCGRPSPPAPLPRCGCSSPPAPLPRCGRPSPPAPLPRCGRGVLLTPGPAPALREALTPNPSPALRVALTPNPSPALRACPHPQPRSRAAGEGCSSPPAPLPRCGRGVIWFVNSVSLKTQERHCYAQLPLSLPV